MDKNVKNNICRTCLSKENLINLFEDCNEEICLIDKLMYCTFIDIKLNDGLPSQICLDCVKNINMCFDFAKKCELSEMSLLQNKVPSEICTEIVTISPEIVLQDHCYVLDSNLKDGKIKRKPKLKPPFKCTKCGDQFEMFHLLKEHYKIHKTKEFAYTNCKYCDKKVSFRNLKQHESIHTNAKSYCCEFCGRNFNHESNFRRHRRIHTGEKQFICEFCGKKFIQKASLRDHRRLHTGDRPFICEICGKNFRNSSYFNWHIKQHSKGSNLKKLDTTDKNDSLQNSSDVVPTSYNCQHCSQQFTTLRAMKTHSLIHKEQNFKCEICFRTFVDALKLNSHLKIHTDERRFSCKICNKKFLTNSYLKRHNLLHSEQKPYSCDLCNKNFTQIGHLKYHKRIHTNEKPFTCKFCNKSFRLNGNLTVHIRTHTKSTPHVCKICQKGFCDTNGLKVHLKNNHK